MHTDLCVACAQSLIIDPDALSKELDPNGIAADKNPSSLKVEALPVTYGQYVYFGEFGLFAYDAMPDGPCKWPHHPCYFLETGPARTVSFPGLAELSAPSCDFCQKLKLLFTNHCRDVRHRYPLAEEPSHLDFRIQYEWLQQYESQGFSVDKSAYSMVLVVLVKSLWRNPITVKDGNPVDAFMFSVVAWPGRCQEWLGISKRPIDPDGPLSSRNVDMIRGLISECDGEHGCYPDGDDSNAFLPTRLLEIHSKDTSVTLLDNARTQLASSRREEIRYATLSYCWGNFMPLKTTSVTLQQHCNGIPVAGLPLVFREAVTVASVLGLRYLWIDALCIVQDDKDDWERESVCMADIYASSYITIAAAASSHCGESFLSRHLMDTLQIGFGSSSLPDLKGEYELVKEPLFDDDNETRPDYESSSWNSRAWVWQEQTMSARVLIFGSNTLHLQCRERIVRENGETNTWNIFKFDMHSWSTIMDDYTCRLITDPSDRLAALCGVAKATKQKFINAGKSAEYLAGLWNIEEHPEQLSWESRSPLKTFDGMLAELNDDGSYIAPSWSWASRSGRCWHEWGSNIPRKSSIRLLRYHLPPARTDPDIAVRPGSSITLLGKLVAGPVMMAECARCIEARMPSSLLLILDWRDWAQDVDSAEGAAIKCQEVNRRGCDFVITMRAQTEVGEHIWGLVVIRFEQQPGVFVYQRVGSFDVRLGCEWVEELPQQEIVII